MSPTLADPYLVSAIRPDWVLEPEAMGSKEKFWFRNPSDGANWLFKFPQPNTGQHWAEKIAAEVAQAMGVLHAQVELAQFEETRGSATKSFARRGRELFHGNQLLSGFVVGYDEARRFHQSEHTLENIFVAVAAGFTTERGKWISKRRIAELIVLDALIGNTDRHHENWGILIRMTPEGPLAIVAPSFDHASSLGRELVDEGPGRSRRRLIEERRIPDYAARGRGAIFWNRDDPHGLCPLELLRRAVAAYPDLFSGPLRRPDRLNREILTRIVNRVAEEWMSQMARSFAIEFLCHNLEQIKAINT
jgi:hypothetical protein